MPFGDMHAAAAPSCVPDWHADSLGGSQANRIALAYLVKIHLKVPL